MDKKKLAYYVHYSVSVVGGFLGGYALLNHHELFGNAQTANLIHMAMNIVGQDFIDFLLRLLDLVLYLSGFACTVFLPKYTKWNLHFCSVIFNFLTVIILFFMPKGISDYIALAPVFFATAFQWNSFKGAGGFVSSSIFSTNNLRQFSTSFFEYLCDKDKEHLKKTKFYGMVLLSFHIGVVIAYVATKTWGLKGVLMGSLLVLLSGVLVCIDNGWVSAFRFRIRLLYVRRHGVGNRRTCS